MAHDEAAKLPVAIAEKLLALDVPHIDEYFGAWSILLEPFRAAIERVNRLDLAMHVQTVRAQGELLAAEGRFGYDVAPGGVAIVNLSGPLMKYASSLSGGSSTAVARRQLRNAANDEAVASILLRIDSPGGTVSGTADLADDVARAAKAKPLVAYIEDMGASAAYWIASQAPKVYANPTAIIGSIGTYAVLQDSSGWAEKQGLKVHVVKAGEFKGAGIDGTQITPEQLAEFQEMVNGLNEHFIRGVAAGRKLTLTKTRELADGRTYIGAAAQERDLIDGVQSFDQTLQQLQQRKPRSAAKMSADNTAPAADAASQPKPATYHELANGCAGADATFICSQLAANATLAQAQAAWMAEQNKRLEAAKAEAAQAKAAANRPGVDPLGAGTGGPAASGDADPTAAWTKAVDEAMAAGKLQRAQAIARVAAERPELHKAYLESFNAEHRRKHPPRR